MKTKRFWHYFSSVLVIASVLMNTESSFAGKILVPGDIVVFEDVTDDQMTNIDILDGGLQRVCDPLHPPKAEVDLAVGPTGTVFYISEAHYVLSFDEPRPFFVMEYNPATCVRSSIASIPLPNDSDPGLTNIEVNTDGTIFVTINNGVYEVDRINGEIVPLSVAGLISNNIESFALDNNDDLLVLTDPDPAGSLSAIIRVDTQTGAQELVFQALVSEQDYMLSPHDIIVGSDGRIFVFDVRDPGIEFDWEIRIFEIDAANGISILRNAEGRGPNNRGSTGNGTPLSLIGHPVGGIAISNDNRFIYFKDGQVVDGGPPGISYLDLNDTPNTAGAIPRYRLSSWHDRLLRWTKRIDVVPEVTGPTFDDVPQDYWAYAFIETIAQLGITRGCGNNNFCPDAPVTRAQMAVFIERAMRGRTFRPAAAQGNVFDDVPADHWAADFIEQLSLDGITSGCGNNNFCPDDEITRDQMAVFLLRAKNFGQHYLPPPATGTFSDVPLDYWVADWIDQLAEEGITSGCGNGKYCPLGVVRRDQMAIFLNRTFGL